VSVQEISSPVECEDRVDFGRPIAQIGTQAAYNRCHAAAQFDASHRRAMHERGKTASRWAAKPEKPLQTVPNG